MLNLLFISLTFSSFIQATEFRCDQSGGNSVFCESSGRTGLEFFVDYKKSSLQRKPIYIKSELSSLFLVREAVLVDGKEFLVCWGTVDTSCNQVLLFCSNNEEDLEVIPEVLLAKVKPSIIDN